MFNFPRLTNFEQMGLLAEIVGLALILFAAIWQTNFGDANSRHAAEDAARAQRQANAMIIVGLQQLAEITAETDPVKRKQYATMMRDDMQMKGELMEIYLKSERIAVEVTPIISTPRLYMAVLGAVMIIVGKFLVLRHRLGHQPEI